MSASETFSNKNLSTDSGREIFPFLCKTSASESDDYYIDQETGFMVFTAKYHLKRGYCCGSGCRHCPFPKDSK